jgi:hypothetical protein
MGAVCTLKLTLTVNVLEPSMNVTVPLYTPAASVELRVEALMVTVREVFPFNVPLVGVADNQFAPSLVLTLADQLPTAPQFVSETVCAGGSLTCNVALNLSAFGEAVMQSACTVKFTLSVSVILLAWLEKVTSAL